MKQLAASELIVNKDGSIYHLGILPEHLFSTVITVGDPERVSALSKYFDKTYFSIQNREFKTVGGSLAGKDITIISTGIGTDNVDIVFNELAFLANFDLKTLKQKKENQSLDIIRLGTSGSISNQHPLDSIVYSKYAVSMEDLFMFYNHSFDKVPFGDLTFPVIPSSTKLEHKFSKYAPSLTVTAKGFYGPQFRNAQLKPKYSLEDVCKVSYKDMMAGNMEMETSGIYGLSHLLGFEAISINALLADRLNGEFSKNADETIERMITESLDIICS